MNSSLSQNPGFRDHCLKSALLVSLLCSFAFPGSAQSHPQKRITSVWTATTAAGSTVHVVSDASVSDYEAYTQGGRFYVKIPQADLPTARGSLLGRGFDDVQIQRYGTGIIISFHLLPGTSARVQQVGSQLEIVFVLVGKAASAVSTLNENNQTRSRSTAEEAGPAPKPQQPRTKGNRHSSASLSNSGLEANRTKDSTAGPAESPGATPAPTPAGSPAASDSTTAGTATTSSASPSQSVTSALSQTSSQSQPSIAPTPDTSTQSQSTDWRSRANYFKAWAELNSVPLAIATVIVVALLVGLFFWRTAKRLKEAQREPSSTTAVTSGPVAPSQPKSAEIPPSSTATNAASAAAGANQVNAGNQSTSASPEEGTDPDREVFEL